MTWTSRIPAVQAAMDQALMDGLTAAAQHYANEVKQDLRGGYTSGAFVSGNVINSVAVDPGQRRGDVLEARVGTDVMYALFWEVGHQNLFTRRYERVEIWRPRLLWESERMRARVLTVAKARLRSMGPSVGAA